MHQLFDEVIGTPPPTTIDSRAIVRHDRRVRATLWSTLGATAMAAGLAVIVLATGGGPAGTPPVGAPPADPMVRPDNRLELRSATREEAQVSAARLKAALDAAVRAAVPSAQWDPKGFDITVIDYVSPLGWIGPAGVTNGGVTGSVNVMLHGFPTSIKIDPLTCATLAAVPDKKADGQRGDNPASAPPCVDATTASGKPVVTYTMNTKDTKRFEVRIGLADNRVMTITSGGDENTPALTLDHLVRIAQEATDRIK
ncbi:hypothetical protein [Virgisporangium aurantiacum]|uniref:Uncharacterized protein n=1 Tax=Virgisporangium aurantiacum TaxID=175570 RepID=A0A8J3Z6B0_9ACTN|nr:hypothetical protein [Virgisporangium aurantiacum]GIJ57737.1 hypothetical protein Vau01_052530 [Virgisporangium aurantiacum]